MLSGTDCSPKHFDQLLAVMESWKVIFNFSKYVREYIRGRLSETGTVAEEQQWQYDSTVIEKLETYTVACNWVHAVHKEPTVIAVRHKPVRSC